MGEMSVLSPNGDDKILWDCNNPDEVENAKKQFKELKDKDYTFYELLTNGDQGKEIKKFDPTIESILAIGTTKKG